MSLESINVPEAREPRESEVLAKAFQELRTHEHSEVFERLERDLLDAGFSLGTSETVTRLMNDNSLMCRSESFSKVIDLITTSKPLGVSNKGDANMCIIASGAGFRIAMQEGFSGRDVEGMVKTVVTFKPDHLTSRTSLPSDDRLWNTKPETAQVSLAGGGEILSEDVAMISFRFPISFYPEHLLTEEEQDLLEEQKIHFIVRHYVPHHDIKEETMH